jgi:hypothetical protein
MIDCIAIGDVNIYLSRYCLFGQWQEDDSAFDPIPFFFCSANCNGVFSSIESSSSYDPSSMK